MIRFSVNGKPEGKARPRFVKKSGHAYTPEKTKNYEQAIAWAYKSAGGKLSDNYIEISVKAFFEIPKSQNKEKRKMMEQGLSRPTSKPDIDNIIKAVLDGLNKTAYNDDKQVVKVSGEKFYSYEPCIIVEVTDYEARP